MADSKQFSILESAVFSKTKIVESVDCKIKVMSKCHAVLMNELNRNIVMPNRNSIFW